MLAFVVGIAGGLVAFVYVAVRAAAIAWYRTRLEHLRKVWKYIGRNGELL